MCAALRNHSQHVVEEPLAPAIIEESAVVSIDPGLKKREIKVPVHDIDLTCEAFSNS